MTKRKDNHRMSVGLLDEAGKWEGTKQAGWWAAAGRRGDGRNSYLLTPQA